ncbi:hypothetical protein C8F01DRAFT_1136672 [Mycena amicta]|nr:hypothetical protein C8F01DRAFT_1136672 [Mycena amicta]
MATEGRPLHPALDRQRLQGLPMTLRRHAIAAWESTASVESLHRLVTWTKTSRMRDSDRPLLLPICFVHLDPNLIPSREQLATLDDPEIQNASTPVASQVERVPHAVAALQLFVAAADAPYGSEPWLWPRLWGWFQFLDTHFDLLSAVHLRIALNEKEQSRGMNALVFVQATHWFSRTSEVLATQGLKEVIGRALSRLLHAENLKTTFPPWSAAANIISSLEFHDLENPRSLAELAEGIGGRGRLAEIIVTLMRRLADAAELSLIDGERLYLIRSLAGMLQRADGAYLDTERRESNLLAPPRKLSQRLLRLNIVPMLVRTLACISLTTSPSDITVQTYTKTHSLLMRLLATTIGARWIDQALDAGLLDTLIQSSRNGYFVGHDIRELRRFFTEILPQALTYHHTVASLHGAGTRIESHLGATDFRASPFYDILVTFIEAAAAQQAVSIKEFLRMLEASMNRSCDNLACEVVEVQTPQLRIRMKCCSSCRVAYYCTKACQAIDWKAGHRYVCCRYTSWSPGTFLLPSGPFLILP